MLPLESKFKLEKINNFLIQITPISLEEKILFVRNFQVMIKAGLSLSLILKILVEQTKNRKLRKVLFEIHQGVEKGGLLSENFAKYPSVFPEIFVNMIKAGEESGKLEDILNQIVIQMKKIHELMGKVRGAMIYPAVVVIMMIIIGILVMTFVVPKIITIFEEVQVALPLATRLLIAISKFTSQHGLIVLGVAALFIVLFSKLISTKSGKFYFHFCLLKMPVFSEIVKKVNLAKFSRTFSSLLAAGLSIIETFRITSGVLSNVHYRNFVFKATEEIKKGESIAKTLKKSPQLFPPVVTQMIAVGEETGTLDSILDDLTEFYETDVKETMDAFASIIEPILIVLLGIAVAGLAIAIIMPMYSLTQQI